MESFVLNFTPTGMVPTREDTPHVPISPEQIAEQVAEAVEVGITMVHIHAREADGTPSHDTDIYADIIGRIRQFAPDLIICVSLSGRLKRDFESRSAPLHLTGDLKPDMGSLTLSSLNFSRQASMNAPDMVQKLAALMLEKGIVPELEAFDSGMINYACYLAGKGLIQEPFYFNLLLGNPANAQCDPLALGDMLARLPDNSLWAVAGIGRAQTRAAMMGLAAGGGVRVGLEDNLHYDLARTQLATNIDLVKRIHRLASELERRVMTAAECREKLNLLPGHGEYGRAAT